MEEFLGIALSFPTVIYSVLLVVVIIYWLMVIVGIFDIDSLDLDVELDGAVDGALEGAADGAAEGALEGAADGAAEGAVDGVGAGALAGVFTALSLKGVPITITLSVFTLYNWFLCYSGHFYLAGGSLLTRLGVFAGSLVLATLLTSLTLRPLKKLFANPPDKIGQRSLIGKECVISTSRVDYRFGQAFLNDGGAGLNLSVRCDKENKLIKGSKALIIDYDKEANLYHVEPSEELMLPRHKASKED